MCDDQWANVCVQLVDSEDVVQSYADGPVKESGTFGSGAWHVKKGVYHDWHEILTQRIPGAPSALQRAGRAPVHPAVSDAHPT